MAGSSGVLELVMEITVEFFGIPRQRVGQQTTRLSLAPPVSLGMVLEELTARFPGLACDCIDAGELQAGFLASIDGDRFISDPSSSIAEGNRVLILSADAGG